MEWMKVNVYVKDIQNISIYLWTKRKGREWLTTYYKTLNKL
jgi:hypothetical protein